MTSMIEATKPKSDQLNADDLIGRTMTITITEVRIKTGEQPISVHFEGDNGKPYKPCKQMARMMMHVWTEDAKNYVGKSMTLYRDPKVTFGAGEVGGIRISHMSDISGPVTVFLTVTKASRKPFTVKPLVMDIPSAPAAQSKGEKMADEICDRIEKAADIAALEAITGHKTVIEWRAKFKEHDARLAAKVDKAVGDALNRFSAPADDFPGDMDFHNEAAA